MMRKTGWIVSSAAAFVLAFSGGAFAKCNYTQKDIYKDLPFPMGQVKIVKQQEVQKGVCSVIFETTKGPKRFVPVFVLEKGGVIVGGMFKDKIPVTAKTINKIKEKETAKVFKTIAPKLKEITAAEYKPKNWNKGVIYAFVDPLCPYCHMAEKHFKEIADETGYAVAIVPFIVHGKPAKDKMESFICNGKSFDDYLSEKYGKAKTCEKADKKIKEAYDVALKLGVGGTPTFFFDSGEMVVGANIKELKEKAKKLSERR